MSRIRRATGASALALALLISVAACTPLETALSGSGLPAGLHTEPAIIAPPTDTAPPATITPTPTVFPTAATPTPTPTAVAPAVPTATPTKATTPVASTPPAPPSFDKHLYPTNVPSSLWVVSNKTRPLNPVSYAPPDLVTAPVKSQNPPVLRSEASAALVKMFGASVKEGAGAMQVQSAYRSYTVQVRVYNGWVKSLGQKQADAQSARAGFSEHQTGLAVDISPVPLTCALNACFGTTPQGKWLAANAYRFGYILRYPADKVPVTGFTYEPWHFRYVGIALSTQMHERGVKTLEEFFGLPAAPDYK